MLVLTGIALFWRKNEIVYFDSFGVEHDPKDIEKPIEDKNIKANIFTIQSSNSINSIMCGCFCIGFIDFMLAGKTLTDCTSLFSPFGFQKSNDIILNCFKDGWIQFHWNW